jgi:hypothetical protein
MKKCQKIVIALLLLICINSIKAQLTQYEDMSTGINGGLIPAGQNDDTWEVMKPGTTVYVPVGCSNQTFNNGGGLIQMYSPVLTNVMLLSPSMDAAFSTKGTTQGVYLYKMTFWHFSCSKVSATMHFNWIGADNQLQGIKVNSTYLGIGGGYSFNPWSNNVNITVPISSIVQGLNTIIIEVRNDHGPLPVTGPAYITPTGLLIDGGLTIKYMPLGLNPVIATAPNLFCAGTPLQFSGSAAFGSVINHTWQMQECSSTGVITSGGYSYSSGVIFGNPSTFTFPNPPCGKYYLVKLAVNNACSTNETDTKIIFVACNPSKPTYTGNTTLCRGQSTTLCSYALKGQYVTWYVNGVAYMQNCITITPNNSTTVVLTISNNNGCSSSLSVPITLVDNDPSFNLATNYTMGNSYYTVSLTPVDIYGYSVAGFGFSFWIEEVMETSPGVFVGVPGTNTQASTGPINCWWIYPGPVNFSGYSGVSNVTCGTPAVGQFTIGKKYRITRGTWNNYCPWDQSSQVVYMSGPLRREVGQGSTPTVTIIKETNTPDYSSFKPSKVSTISKDVTANVSISPNPSNGLFTIELDADAIASIEVYDSTGKKVKSLEQSSTKQVLDLTGYSEGIYLVNITSNGNKISKRVILK